MGMVGCRPPTATHHVNWESGSPGPVADPKQGM